MFSLTPDYRNKLKTMLLTEEGYRQFPYTDITGHLTIGIGRNIQEVGITIEEALHLLEQDIMRCEHDFWKCLPVYPELSDPRKCVLLDMCFNLGIVKLMQFRKMIDALNKKDYSLAAQEMMDSDWAKQVGHRADKLARIMETGYL